MKKHLLLGAFFILIATASMAQGNAAYSNGDNLFNVGIGIGTPFFGSGYTSSLPINPTLSFEKGITDAISVGGQLSYASSKFSYFDGFGTSTFKESATYIGARGSYHLGQTLDMDSSFDLYGGASLGYVIVSVNGGGFSGSAASGLGLGIFAGGKYFVQSNTAIYAELGYQSLSFLSLGVSFRF